MLRGGGSRYVSKPFRNPELVARITTHLKIRQLQKKLEQEHQKMNAILENVLPGSYVTELKNGVRPRTEMHENVVVLFTDFQNFTGISRDLGPEKSINHLNEIFFAFDEIITRIRARTGQNYWGWIFCHSRYSYSQRGCSDTGYCRFAQNARIRAHLQ
jgi:response regulator RpfG family c-di-GMP phosphodiesterase